MTRAFLDSNVLVYAFSTDPRAERALALLHAGAAIGIQTLNEFANVSRLKAGRRWAEIELHLGKLLQLFPEPIPVDLSVHENGVRLAARYKFRLWDAMMVAAALTSGCDVLWTEDLQDGLVVDGNCR